MSPLRTIIAIAALCALALSPLQAATYVTDTGGYAYDESRAMANFAPAIALGTLAIVGIIAIAVQNSHDHTSSASSHCYDSSSHGSYSYCYH